MRWTGNSNEGNGCREVNAVPRKSLNARRYANQKEIRGRGGKIVSPEPSTDESGCLNHRESEFEGQLAEFGGLGRVPPSKDCQLTTLGSRAVVGGNGAGK